MRLDEFQERRFRLMEGIHKHASKHDNNLKQHLVVIPSATKVYMTQKIPYVFRQNTDFLYLSGCLEPDSALVLTGMRGDDHLSTLFVRERDTHSELWDGPRTGVEGAPALFGLDQAYALTDLESFIASFMRSHRNFILWYDFMNPAQPDVHRILREFLGDTWNKVCAFGCAVNMGSSFQWKHRKLSVNNNNINELITFDLLEVIFICQTWVRFFIFRFICPVV